MNPEVPRPFRTADPLGSPVRKDGENREGLMPQFAGEHGGADDVPVTGASARHAGNVRLDGPRSEAPAAVGGSLPSAGRDSAH